jgi:hypothetical protein
MIVYGEVANRFLKFFVPDGTFHIFEVATKNLDQNIETNIRRYATYGYGVDEQRNNSACQNAFE